MKKTKTKAIEKAEEKAEEKFGTSSVDVISKSGSFIRAFDVENHGLKFLELAEMFSRKIGGRVEKSK